MLLPALLNGNKLLAMTPSWSELTPRERKRHLELESEEDPRKKDRKQQQPLHQPGHKHWELGTCYRVPSGPPTQLGTQQDRQELPIWTARLAEGSGFFSRLPRGS